MGYLDDYNSRHGKCEYCKHHNSVESNCCCDCYGGAFEDAVDLYTFIRAKVSKDAIEKFNGTDEGKRLYNMMEQHRQTYNQCKDSYNNAREKFIDEELKRVDDIINSIN
jgi:hypothetical protein